MSRDIKQDLFFDTSIPLAEVRDAMEGMDIYWWFWNNSEKKLQISPKLVKILGYEENEFNSSDPLLEKNVHPDDSAKNSIYLRSLLTNEIDIYEIEYRIKIEGEWVWYYNRGKIIRKDASGKPELLGGITMSMSRNYKRELRASELALHKSEKVLRTLINAADDRIGLFDTAGNIIILNKAFTETLGYTKEEFAELEQRERIHPDDFDRIKLNQSKLYETGHLSSEYRVQHKDGHYIYMFSKSVILKDAEEGKDYVLFIIRDVSERINFEKVLIEEKERAEESDKLKSAFLANMSHEIRTPMNSIIGFSNLLSDENVDEASRKEYIRRINRNSEQLLTLISDIIDLAKIESNQLSVFYSNVILENVFTDLMSYGQQLLKEKHRDNVTLSYDPDPDQLNLNIESDLVRLTQILQNLLNNAIKFTQSGEIVIGYRVVDDTAIRLFVKDTGVGIDREDFKIIFDQFRQIDGSDVRKFGGTGLGLAICRNLAHLLCGEINIDSELGKGTIFNVELPIVSGFLVGVDEDKQFANIKSSASQVVMMVDDDHDSLMLFSTMMRTEGVQVITADSGYKALEMLERETLPDLVLMDLEMPVLSGVQTLRIIKEMYPDLKVVAQSAHALEGDKEKTMVAGFDDYISKPYNRQSLMKVIRGMN